MKTAPKIVYRYRALPALATALDEQGRRAEWITRQLGCGTRQHAWQIVKGKRGASEEQTQTLARQLNMDRDQLFERM